MLHSLRLTPELLVARLLTVSICLFSFAVLPLPQLFMLTGGQSIETECPCQEDGEKPEEELLGTSVRQRLSVCKTSADRRVAGADNFHNKPSKAHFPAIVGHRLANGNFAPLVI